MVSFEIVDSLGKSTVGRILKKTNSNSGKKNNGASVHVVQNLSQKWNPNNSGN